MPSVQRCIAGTIDKIDTLSNEEKLTNFVRKKMHTAINDRTQEVINKLVEQLQQYAETLHQQVQWYITCNGTSLVTPLVQL